MTSRVKAMGRAARSFMEHGGLWVLAQFPLLVIAVVLPLATGTPALPSPIVNPVAAVGALLTAGGVVISVVSAAQLGRALTPFPKPSQQAELRTAGLYAWARHPLYTGVFLTTAGWALWWQSWSAVGFSALLAVFFDRKAACEERWLRERFPRYADYARGVRKFIPGVY